jgi:hypothetical protein
MVTTKLRRYSNQAPETSLNGSITPSDMSLVVHDPNGFPEPPFTISIEGEILLIGAKSGTTFTVEERAFDNSIPAATHPDGASVKHVLVADDFRYRWQDVIVDRPFDVLDDEFDDEDHSNLNKVNLGTANWTESNGILSCLFGGQTTNQTAASLTTLSTLGIGSAAQTAVRLMAGANTANAGVLLSSGGTTTDSVVWQYAILTPGSSTMSLALRSGTFLSTSTLHFSTNVNHMIGGWIHMRLVWVSVNTFRAWWSPDGISWSDFGQGAHVITGVNPPTRMGLGVSARGGSGDKIASFEYLRVWSP